MEDKWSRSPYFRIEEVRAGVFAAIATPGMGAWSNSGIVDLGGVTLVVDSCASPGAASDLLSAAVTLTGRSPSYVVLTHGHWDHILGAEVFARAHIIATESTRATMLDSEVSLRREDLDSGFAQHLRELREQQERQTDQRIVQALDIEILENQELLKNLKAARLHHPEVTFAERLLLHGSQRSVEVLCYGGGHSGGDAFVYLPSDSVAFMGDLVASRRHAWVGSGSISAWYSILERFSRLDTDTIVPGHGNVTRRQAVAETMQYLLKVQEAASC